MSALAGTGEEDSFESLHIVFHIAGSMWSPEHVGVRRAKFSKKDRMLMLQIAVPKDVVESEETEIEQFVLAHLREAVCLAEPVFKRAKVPYRKDSYIELIRRAGQRLTH